jgi:hypothetical protein
MQLDDRLFQQQGTTAHCHSSYLMGLNLLSQSVSNKDHHSAKSWKLRVLKKISRSYPAFTQTTLNIVLLRYTRPELGLLFVCLGACAVAYSTAKLSAAFGDSLHKVDSCTTCYAEHYFWNRNSSPCSWDFKFSLKLPALKSRSESTSNRPTTISRTFQSQR